MAAVGQRRARSPTRVFFVPPSRHLLCSICSESFNEVVLPCADGHTFCRACVHRWFEGQRTCPACATAIPAHAALLPNRLARTQVDELRVRCRFGVKEEGDIWVADETSCPAQLSLDGAAAHEASCDFATVACPFAGCGVELRRSDITSHNATSVQTHLDGERSARLADATALAVIAASAAAATSRLALVEARLIALEQQRPPLVGAAVATVPLMLSSGWAVRHTIHAVEAGLPNYKSRISCCAFSPDSSTVCIGLQVNTLQLFDVTSGEHRATLEGHLGPVCCCAFFPDGSTLVSGSFDLFVKLWDAASGAVICTLEGHTDYITSCAVSPDGWFLCSGSGDKSLKLWDAASGECQRTLEDHTDVVRCCAYNVDGTTILFGGADHTLKLWSAATGVCIRTFTGHSLWVLDCCFSPAEGNTILSCSNDYTLKLWDATTGVCRRTLTGHGGCVRGCAFSPVSGNLVLSCSDDKDLKLWTRTGACPATLKGHESGVWSCAISGDGYNIASGGSEDGTLVLWRRT